MQKSKWRVRARSSVLGLMAIGGATSISWGAYLVAPAAGFIVGGIISLVAAIAATRGGGEES
jgi:hypothetical protein